MIDELRSIDRPSVDARMDFVVPGTPPYRRFVARGAEFSTGRYETHEVSVSDGRPFRDRFTLDTAGFTLLDHRTAVKDFFDTDEVNRTYPAEVVEAVTRAMGADHVFPIGWFIRTSGDKEKLKESVGYKQGGGGIQPPAADVHVDIHWAHAEKRAREMYDRLMPGGPGYSRFVVTSFWRTFSEPPQDWPLALCESASVPAGAGIPNVMVIVDDLPDEAGLYGPLAGEEDMLAASVFPFDPGFRWWYFANMTKQEALLFKFFDSDHSRAWRVPHTAFHDTSRPDAKTRRSIEFRTIAFFD